MARTAFRSLALLSEQLEKTASRLEETESISQLLIKLAPDEVPPVVRLLIGQVFPEWDERSLNLSWRAILKVVADLTGAGEEDWQQAFEQAVDAGEAVRLLMEKSREAPSRTSRLTVLQVYDSFQAIAETKGKGSRARKEELLSSLMERADPVEAKYLVKNILREMRHGVSEGILLDAIAQASGAKKKLVRRANMFLGDLGEVALVAMEQGEAGLQGIRPLLFRPLKPMLAQPAKNLKEAFEYHEGEIALEYKLDGARVQIHKDGPTVRIFTRSLSEVTSSLPEVVDEVCSEAGVNQAILEGEVIAVDHEGRPLPFQHLMRRFRRVHDVDQIARQVPVRLHLFDVLYHDGESLVDLPYTERWHLLEEIKGGLSTAGRTVPRDLAEGEAFTQQAYAEGHEGVMVKDLRSPYHPDVRGKSWFKVKHVLSLDLVIVAADWGYGRRHGWLSNYHLAARDDKKSSFEEVGKTFKGLTDDEFRQMTDRLLALEISRKGGTVFVEPRVVVEVLFNEIQSSPQYASGLALRFARISRIREDKRPEDADTLQTLTTLFSQQFEQKGQFEDTQGGPPP